MILHINDTTRTILPPPRPKNAQAWRIGSKEARTVLALARAHQKEIQAHWEIYFALSAEMLRGITARVGVGECLETARAKLAFLEETANTDLDVASEVSKYTTQLIHDNHTLLSEYKTYLNEEILRETAERNTCQEYVTHRISQDRAGGLSGRTDTDERQALNPACLKLDQLFGDRAEVINFLEWTSSVTTDPPRPLNDGNNA